MKKKITLLTAGVLCIASIAIGVAATEIVREIKAELRPDFTVVIDGETKHFKNANGDTVYPVLYDGTTYLPVRAIGEIMGKTVFWYENEKKIELKESTVTDADVIVTDTTTNNASVTSDSPADKPVQNRTPNAQLPKIDETKFIGKDKAQEIALNKAGLTTNDVIFDRTELDKDNGKYHYEVEFKHGRTEYEADISAIDGTILSWKVDKDD